VKYAIFHSLTNHQPAVTAASSAQLPIKLSQEYVIISISQAKSLKGSVPIVKSTQVVLFNHTTHTMFSACED